MSTKVKAALIGLVGVLVAGGAYFVLADKEDIPLIGERFKPSTCPLTGEKPKNEDLIDRPAVAIKVENAPVAYPLSGLEDADIVYEELVEGGVTRFMAIYHCGDTPKAGPIRSARAVDPSIMIPTTRLLAFSGGNQGVLDDLAENEIVQIDENKAGAAMQRVPREGLATEHTLYGDSSKLRRVGQEDFGDAPPGGLEFGDLEGNGQTMAARNVTIEFSETTTVNYEFNGERYARFQQGGPFQSEGHGQIGVENVIVEEHTVNLSEVVDVTGTPSIEIADETGSGRATLFRNGRAIQGTWERESIDDVVVFKTRSGDDMVLAPGAVWIHLVPNSKSEVEGSFDFGN
ncbi:MAG: DUF3048 domain-containing protein [Actinobacteria bacterium]|nr:DUF3048 domain-containing protein [Actinomycetota bacterium]